MTPAGISAQFFIVCILRSHAPWSY